MNDTHLLALIESLTVKAGSAGNGGSGGSGGSGGWGGSGGSSYNWTTTRTVTKTRSASRRNSNGTTDYYTETYTDTEYDYHVSQGGSSGASGSSGYSGSAGSRGNTAADGSYAYRVQSEDGTAKTYQTIWDLSLRGYSIIDETADGIFEPGERAFVRGVTVSNTGGMPSPRIGRAHIPLWLEGNDLVVPEAAKLALPKSLAVGETFEFARELPFALSNLNRSLATTVIKAKVALRQKGKSIPSTARCEDSLAMPLSPSSSQSRFRY